MKVLVVEDEPALQLLYERILAKVTYDVIVAQDGNYAIQILGSNYIPNLIILDIRMPNCSGLQVLEYLQTYPYIEHTHVVIATASRDFESYVSMLPSCEFLLKPVLTPHILEIVERLQTIKGV